MLLLNLLLLFGISFFGFSCIVGYKKWNLSRKYQYQIKGYIHNITVDSDKVYFIVKWHTPNELRDNNPQDQMNSGIQYYHHFVQQAPIFKDESDKTEFIAQWLKKYLDKPFYLQASESNGIIREIIPYTGGGGSIFLNGLALSIFITALYYKTQILSWF